VQKPVVGSSNSNRPWITSTDWQIRTEEYPLPPPQQKISTSKKRASIPDWIFLFRLGTIEEVGSGMPDQTPKPTPEILSYFSASVAPYLGGTSLDRWQIGCKLLFGMNLSSFKNSADLTACSE
jgi:hypothetical protein